MRCVVLVIALVARSAAAEPALGPDEAKPDPDRGNFWRNVAEPHRDEVEAILTSAHAALEQLDRAMRSDAQPPAAKRRSIGSDLVHMLRYARRLEPTDVDVLRMLAHVAEATGDARQARDALQALTEVGGEEHAGVDALDLMGAAALRAGHLDDAIRVLRQAQGPVVGGQPATASVLVHLATALALRGHSAQAIDALLGALPADGGTYEPSELALVAFALAVAYDRDEQRGAAFEVLDAMRAGLADQFAPSLQMALGLVHFAPAEDELYYRALMYEVVGDRAEARTEWLLYAADDAAPYRHRAIDHVRALDRQPRERELVPPPAVPGPMPPGVP